jgi:NAD(P)-dependent dehydrogenase (short-subunit alcohol dehydrogenase family)
MLESGCALRQTRVREDEPLQERKVVVITGASQGIGARLVRRFRELGYGVVANSRSISENAAGDDQTFAVRGDVAAPETSERIIGCALQRFGRIDTLINNAGVFIPKPFIDYSAADFETLTGVNLAGFFHLSQKVATLMMQAGSGHIINITAALADQPMASVPAALAALTKGGLNAVTRSLAIEYASHGIRVNAVAPGAIKTPMHPPETHRFLSGLHPMGRMGEMEEVADAVVYLEKAAFVTGEILHVDGGAHAGCW